MSYRKPVPIYVPSPPSSPPFSSSMRLSLALGPGTDDHTPPLPDDWRDIIEQALTDGPENLFMSDEVLIGRPVRPQPSRENRGMGKNHAQGHQVWSEDRSALRSAVYSPISPGSGKPHKRKLPQHYRPPTPPLPAHYNQRRSPDNELLLFNTHMPCVTPKHVQERHCPMPRRELSVKAASFSTIWTKSPSFKTENTYSSFGNSEPSVLFSSSYATYAGLGAELPVLPTQLGRSETVVKVSSARRFISSWRALLESWGTSLKVKLRSFTRMCVC